MTFTLLSQSSSSPCQHPANHYNTSIITLLHYNKDMPFFIPINLSWFFPKIMFYKTLKTTNLQSSKIQGTYFKICALYFKIYGLYFLLFQIFEKQRLIKGEKCSLFSCRFSVIFSAFEAFLIAYRRVRLLDGLS